MDYPYYLIIANISFLIFIIGILIRLISQLSKVEQELKWIDKCVKSLVKDAGIKKR